MTEILPSIMDGLKQKLTELFGLEEARCMSELVAAGDRGEAKEGRNVANTSPPRRFLFAPALDQPLKLLVASDFEFEVQGLVVDQRLGTIGIVQRCPASVPVAGARSVTQQVESFAQHAVYLRHRLEELETNGGRPYFVELVLVVPREHIAERADMMGVLHKLMEQTTYLHAIGINFLWEGECGGFDRAGLRRTFSWLLTDAELWYKANSAKVHPAAAANRASLPQRTTTWYGQLGALSLEDFRLLGKRDWRLSDEVLHVVHGRNGTGKSTLVEAMELAMTGRIERLEDATCKARHDYAKVLCNRTAASEGRASAKIGMSLGNPSQDVREVRWEISPTKSPSEKLVPIENAAELPFPFEGFHDAGSFRLDQLLSDELVRSEPCRRAERFLAAFFPSDKQAIEDALHAERGFKEAWESLGPEMRRLATWSSAGQGASCPPKAPSKKPAAKEVIQNLQWLDDPDQAASILAEYTPLGDLERELIGLDLLGKLGASSATPRDTSTIELWFRSRDEARKDARQLADVLSLGIGPLIKLVEELNEWQAKTAGKYGRLGELAQEMNEWLELHVLCDLAAKEADVLATVQAAREAGADERLRPLQLAKLGAASPDPCLLGELRLRRDAARSNVASFRLEETTERSVTPRLKYPDERLRLCDKLFPLEPQRLSSLIEKAVSAETVVDVVVDGATIVIGSRGGCRPLLDRLKDLQQRLDAVKKTASTTKSGFADFYRQLVSLREAAGKRATTEEQALDRFHEHVHKDGRLANALNELTALLTPARWAYEDLAPHADESGDRPGLDFRTPDEVSLSKRLNTAELNTFTLALFLLCAPKLENPLRLLLLDDPFQNMDELTLLTIVRGLGRLLELWRTSLPSLDSWRVVLLLHSAEGVERCRREVPCATYYLPWLSPLGVGPEYHGQDGGVIQPEPSRLSHELNSLTSLRAVE